MLTSGFTSAPISRLLLFSLVSSSLLVSITDTKYLFPIQVVPHLWPFRQAWRVLTWQMCYTNSTELLFATMTLYHLRIIERLWGERKFASFVLSALAYTSLLCPLLLALLLRPLSFNKVNYLPAGPTPLVFALLAQYHAAIPHVYKYRLATGTSTTGSSSGNSGSLPGLTFTDKSTTYLVAAQLALSQLPGSALAALVGWVIGHAWRNELLPGAAARWRVPAWVVRDGREGESYEGLRRRLEGEVRAEGARASGIEGERGAATQQRRPLGTQMLDQFRGSF